MTTNNYQQLNKKTKANNNKKQPKTKQTTRTGTESQKWRSQGGLSVGEWVGREGERYRE